ncbi:MULTISPECIES: DUF1285 domain-containing protein [unclassified Corallococcus]|uniref:DUF1285 domain-containing protein n=1 Tax=unclassified Corallococcus TaxID=2685029 RepID=UPI001A9092D4|nr:MULTISPECIES: DUF1285 domain-containing protein [unclassified Corallococcus]MBN9687863.1 DUF1285 domain-containing protein [Corallococcus sp. NCSPR001]WAS88325.1 DUF1285 domain-containing protein [Corallococcus sp. NCRR]
MQPPTGQPPPGKRWHTREDSGIRLDAALRWWHDDEPIEHPKIIELFNASLVLDDDGRYQLRIAPDWCYVQVEDAAYEVRTVDITPDERVSLRLSDRTAEALDLGSLQLTPDGVLTCRVKQGRAKARFSRDAQYQFGELLEESPEGHLVLRVGQRHWEVPLSLDALQAAN